MVGSDGRVGLLSADCLQGLQGADLVYPHEATVAGHVTCKDGGKPSLNGCLIRHAVPLAWTGSA
jgi:hypothetical protein